MHEAAYEDYRRQIDRYGGRARIAVFEFPLIVASIALTAFFCTRLQTPGIRAASAGICLMLSLYLPYAVVKWALRRKMMNHLDDAQRLRTLPWYRPDVRAWAALYLLSWFGLVWLAIGASRLFG